MLLYIGTLKMTSISKSVPSGLSTGIPITSTKLNEFEVGLIAIATISTDFLCSHITLVPSSFSTPKGV